MVVVLHILIVVFGCASYAWGMRDVWRGAYRPSVFSRTVWLALAAVSFVGVLASSDSLGAALLAGVLLAGNGAIFVLSLWRGTREFGKLELLCLALIALSIVSWAAFDSALVGLLMSLVTHLVGAVPTIAHAWSDPRNESSGFWFLFFLASGLGLVVSAGDGLVAAVLPIYFVVFDGAMFVLSLPIRRTRN